MTSAVAVLTVVGIWWLGTGAVFVTARGTPRVRRWIFAGVTVGVAALILAFGPSVSQRTDTVGVVQALLLGFALWAWMELSFYAGFVTGPSTRRPPPGAGFGSRFRHALAACLWHELAIVAGLGLLLWTASGPNPWAAVQFAVFWVLHEVARLNVLVGVPHPFRELLPAHLAHLQPYLEPRPAGPWLQASVLVVAGATVTAAVGAVGADGGGRVGWSAVAVLLGLGVLELGVLLFPVPLARLWNWFGMEGTPEALVPR